MVKNVGVKGSVEKRGTVRKFAGRVEKEGFGKGRVGKDIMEKEGMSSDGNEEEVGRDVGNKERKRWIKTGWERMKENDRKDMERV